MKNNKPILLLLALMLCVGAFAFPITAYAASDTTPPTLTAKLSGEVLHIEATDADSGVEAVFIDGNRINYRVDSALDVILKDYAGTGEYVKIYAMDFAGNKSKEVQIKNPYYVAPAPVPATPKPATPPPAPDPEPAETTPPAESSVQESKPFTPDGSGTTVDNATDGDGKEFFTISTPDENVFYLIIDRQRESENVYFLNAVTEDDLLSLAKKSDGKSGESAVPTPEPAPQPDPTPEPAPEPEPEPPAKNNTGTMVFLLLAVAAAGGAGYYFKILKPKQQAQQSDEFDEDEDEDDYEDDYTDTPDEEEDFYFPDEEQLSTDSIPDDEE